MKKIGKFILNNKLIILCSFLLAILSFGAYLTINTASNLKKIKIELLDSKKNIQISQITIGSSKYDLKNFENQNYKYNEEYNYLSSNIQNSELIITTNEITDVSIMFIKNRENGKIKIETNSKLDKQNKIIDTQSEKIEFEEFKSHVTIKEIIYNKFQDYGIKDYMVIVLVLLTITTIYTLIIKKIIKLLKIMNYRNLSIKECVFFVALAFVIMLNTIYLLLEIFNVVIIIFAILIIAILNKKYSSIFMRVENTFLIFATLMGLSILFIHPPYNVPDEASHYYKAYQVANNISVNNKKSIDATISVPQNIANSIYNYIINLHDVDFKMSAKTILADFNNKYDNNSEMSTVWFGNVTSLPIFCYIPSILIIKLCICLKLPIILSFLLCRFANLLLFIIVVYKSIQFIPKFKRTILTVGLLPITLSQAAAINQDSLTNTLFIFIVAYIIYLIYNENNIDKKDIFILSICGLLLGFCKLVYFPVLLLTILIPNKKFNSVKDKILIIGLVLLVNLTITGINIAGIKGSSTSNSAEYYTLNKLISAPSNTIKIVINTALDRLQLDMLEGVVNGFGWSTKWGKNLFAFLIQSIFIIMYLTSNNEEAKEKIVNIKFRCIIFVITIFIIGLLYLSLLTLYTPNNSLIVQGLQSRYFIPTILLFIIGISNNIIKINLKNTKTFDVTLFTISLAITMFTIINGFYI